MVSNPISSFDLFLINYRSWIMVINMLNPRCKMGLRTNRGSRLRRKREGALDGMDKAPEATTVDEQGQSARVGYRNSMEV